jgi:putative transposase
MVLGFYVSFDSPGAYGTGLALYRAVCAKEKWLDVLGVDQEWPCWGFPVKIHMDNAREFRGEMLKRACEQYGMSIAFRALKKPEYGAHIERWLGTFNQEIHQLPGVRHKPHKRGGFDPETDAAYTLRDLEYHIAMYITGVYHQSMHSGIDSSPIKRWTDAILGDRQKIGMGLPSRPVNEERLRIDLMPFEERTIQTYGVQIDEIRYYDDVLRRYVGRKPASKFIFRYDPRDIRTIFFWDPELDRYYEIPYANLRNPSISIWELRAVRKHLRVEGRKNVDEGLIFKTYEALRLHQANAEAETKRVRQNNERKRRLLHEPKPVAAKSKQTTGNAATEQPSEAPSAGSNVSRPKLTLVPPIKKFGHIEPLEAESL